MGSRPRTLRCLIAAGGTAGHVLPAIAIAESLTARGVSVSFAGSPERIEGFVFDQRHMPAGAREFRKRPEAAEVTIGFRARAGQRHAPARESP